MATMALRRRVYSMTLMPSKKVPRYMYFGTSTNAELCSLAHFWALAQRCNENKSNDNIDLFIEGEIPIAGM